MTPAMFFINVLVFCVTLPLTVVFHHDEELLAPVPFRQKAIAVMALIIGLRLLSVVFLDPFQ